jgi:hypothetical protein
MSILDCGASNSLPQYWHVTVGIAVFLLLVLRGFCYAGTARASIETLPLGSVFNSPHHAPACHTCHTRAARSTRRIESGSRLQSTCAWAESSFPVRAGSRFSGAC